MFKRGFEMTKETIYSPEHYTKGKAEAIDKIAAVLDGIEGENAYLLGNIIKYVLRCEFKGEFTKDLKKANNYAHKLVTGHWRNS